MAVFAMSHVYKVKNINVSKKMTSLETTVIMPKNPLFSTFKPKTKKHDESWNRNDNVEKYFIFNSQITIIYVALILCPQKFMLNSKILILCNELREMSIHINLCLKCQKISRINKNRENKCFRYYEYTRESTKISY